MGDHFVTINVADVLVSIVATTDEQAAQIFEEEEPTSSHMLLLNGPQQVIALLGTPAELDRLSRRIGLQAATELTDARRPYPVEVLAAELGRDAGLARFTDEHYRMAVAERLVLALEARGYDITRQAKEEEGR